jgi:HK97 family phage prohead protease
MKTKLKTNKPELRSFPAQELRVATNDDGSKVVSGYAITYNALSVDLGGFKEIVAPGSLTRSLKENPDVKCLRDHRSELILGRTTAGTLSLEDQPTGLFFRCTLPNTSAANDLAESLSRGDVSGCSFGFNVMNDTWMDDADGNLIRTLLDLNLFEISVTSFPAYPSTTAALRDALQSAPKEIRARLEQRDDDEDEDTDDETASARCLCACPQCVAGDCDGCSDPDCEDEPCSCDNYSKRSRRRLELRLTLLRMNNPA